MLHPLAVRSAGSASIKIDGPSGKLYRAFICITGPESNTGKRGDPMERWKECLAALVPYYNHDGGNATLVFTDGGEIFEDHRTVKWNLRRLARLFSVDLEAARRNQVDYLHYCQGLPLPLSPSLVLVPLKTRRAVGKNDGCHSYLNPSAVVELLEAKDQVNVRSLIVLPGDHRIPCHYTLKTVRKRLRDGAIALERHRAALLPGATISHVSSQDYRKFLEQLVYTLVAEIRQES